MGTLFCHQVIIIIYDSGDVQCRNKDCCDCLLVRRRGGSLTQNGDPRVGKLTFENLKMSYFPFKFSLAPNQELTTAVEHAPFVSP